MPLTYTPQPDFDMNSGGVDPISTAVYRASRIRIRDASQYGWWYPFVSSGTTTVQQMTGAEVGSYHIYDTSELEYFGGLISSPVEIFGVANIFTVFSDGNTDWTLDGSAISGYAPTNLATGLSNGIEYTLSGTMESTGVSRSVKFILHGSSAIVRVNSDVIP